jgi:hypothetical protein
MDIHTSPESQAAASPNENETQQQQGVTEEEVGITEYVAGSLPGFGAILKHRYGGMTAGGC